MHLIQVLNFTMIIAINSPRLKGEMFSLLKEKRNIIQISPYVRRGVLLLNIIVTQKKLHANVVIK